MINRRHHRNHYDNDSERRSNRNQMRRVKSIGVLQQQQYVGVMIFVVLCLQVLLIPSTVCTFVTANEISTTTVTTSTGIQYGCDVPKVKGYQLLYSTKSLKDYTPYLNLDFFFPYDDDFFIPKIPKHRGEEPVPFHDSDIVCYEPNGLTIEAIIPRPCHNDRFSDNGNGTITTTKVTFELQKTRNDEFSVGTTVAVLHNQTESTYPYYLYGKRNKKVNGTSSLEILGRRLSEPELNEQYKLITKTSLVHTTGQVVVEEIMDIDVLRFHVIDCGVYYSWSPPNVCDVCGIQDRDNKEVCLGSVCVPSGNYYSFHLVVTGFTVVDLNFAVTLPIRTTTTNGTQVTYEESFNHDEYFDPYWIVPESDSVLSRFTGATGSTSTLPKKRTTYWNGTAVQGGYDELIKMIKPKIAGLREAPTDENDDSRSHNTNLEIVPSHSETGAYFTGTGWFPCCTCHRQWVKSIVFPNRILMGTRINFDSYKLTFEYLDKCFENGRPVDYGPDYIVEVRRNGKVIRTHSKEEIALSPNTIRNGTKVIYQYTSPI